MQRSLKISSFQLQIVTLFQLFSFSFGEGSQELSSPLSTSSVVRKDAFNSDSNPGNSWKEMDKESNMRTEIFDPQITPANYTPVRICRQRDIMELNECLQGVLEEIRPRLAEGIEEIGLPGVDPLRLNHLSFHHGSGSVNIVSEFTQVEVSGLSSFNKSQFWLNAAERRLDFNFNVSFPQLLLAGLYELSGKMLFVPISGQGNFWLNLGGVSCKGSGELVSDFVDPGKGLSEGHGRVALQKTELDLNIDSIKVHLANLFNGDILLGSVVNNFLNENSQEIFQELRPQIDREVGLIVTTFSNQALSALPSNFFDDIPILEEINKE